VNMPLLNLMPFGDGLLTKEIVMNKNYSD
jgi:hypothetical protein